MASVVSQKFKYLRETAGVNMSSATIKAMLVGTGYTPDAAHDFVSSITSPTNYELSGTGYTGGFSGSGRKTLASQAVTRVDGSLYVKFTANNLTWTAINAGTARYITLYINGTADSDSAIVCTIQFPSDAATSGTDLTINFSSDGIYQST